MYRWRCTVIFQCPWWPSLCTLCIGGYLHFRKYPFKDPVTSTWDAWILLCTYGWAAWVGWCWRMRPSSRPPGEQGQEAGTAGPPDNIKSRWTGVGGGHSRPTWHHVVKVNRGRRRSVNARHFKIYVAGRYICTTVIKKTDTIFFFIYSTLNYSIFFFLLNLIVCYKKTNRVKTRIQKFRPSMFMAA